MPFYRIVIGMLKKLFTWKTFYAVTGFIGLISAVFEIFIYRKTIIDYTVPLLIILFAGITVFIFNKEHYNRTYALSGFFYALCQNIISWGFLISFIFIATNYFLANKDVVEYKFKIVSKSSMPGGKGHRSERQPLVTFNYFNKEKELVFGFENTEEVNQADSVLLRVKKGKLGFDLLDYYTVFK